MPVLLFILLSAMAAVLTGGVWFVRETDQSYRDKTRKTYRLSFPADLSPEQVLTWLRSVSGSMRGGKLRLTGVPTIAFEVFATNKGIVHRLKVPFGQEPYIIPQLRLSGVNATPEEEFENRYWLKGVEAGLTQSSRQLRIYDPSDVAASLLACFQALDPDQAIVMQWVVSPAAPTKLPLQGEETSKELNSRTLLKSPTADKDEVNDRRRKLEEPNFNAVLRVAGYGKTESSAESLVGRIRMALSSIRGPSVRFHRRFVTMDSLRTRIRHAAAPVIFPMQLSSPELSALIAWPMGKPVIAGLAPTMTRHMPAVAAIPVEGRIVGTSTFPGDERPVAVAYKDCVRHTYVLGPSGVGKTTLLDNMMAQDMEKGYGVILIESKGDLFESALKRIPKHRIDDVIIIDVNEQENPVGFNILDQGNTRSSIDEISALISSLYANSSQSIQAPQVIYHMLHALAEVHGHTFVDLPILFSNYPKGTPEADWQDWLVRQLKNKDIRNYMQRFMNMSKTDRDRATAPVLNRTWEFTNRPEIKNIMGQRQSSFKMTDVIADNKILLVNLNGTRVGPQTASIAGTLLVNAVWQAVRQVRPDKANFLYLDEFGDFVNLPVGVEAMLAKARSANLGLVLAHQHTQQLKPETRAAVIANTATKIIFQTTADDANVISREFGGSVERDDLLNLGRHETIVRVATDTGSSPPATVLTRRPGRDQGNAGKAQLLSRNHYGRPIEDVENGLDPRPGSGGSTPRPRPNLSGQGQW